MRMTPVLAAVGLASTLTLLAQPISAQSRAASVQVEVVEMRDVADRTPVLGQLVASVSAQVASRRGGVATEVMFRIGDRVEVDAPLVLLDSMLSRIERRSADAVLESAQAGVSSATARLTQSQQELQRQARLQDSAAFSRAAFDRLEQQVAEARGDLAQANARQREAEAAIASANYQLRHSVIRAPFAGIVTERMAQPGQFVSAGAPVAQLLEVDTLELEADVPSELVDGLRPGLSVEALFADGTRGAAMVRVALPVETISTRTRPVRFTVDLGPVDPSFVAVGKSVTLQVPVSAPRRALTVPKDALVQDKGGWIVYTAVDGKANARPVTIGNAVGERMEVLSGIEAGDEVVVRGNERLRPGQDIAPKPLGG